MEKPFFSIVIPTYNPSKYIERMLYSISQNDCVNEIEVILSDDCSEESLDQYVEKFSQMDIKIIKNEKHAGYPMVGRQRGADAATGEWLTFADQDDYYLYGALDAIKKEIEEQKPETNLCCAIYKELGEERTYVEPTEAWTHGKFIRKSFWDETNLFYDHVERCEDTNIVIKLQCVLIENGQQLCCFKSPVYVWCENDDSLSHKDGVEYYADSLTDYTKTSLGVITDYLEKHQNDELCGIFTKSFIVTLYRVYFYLQSNAFQIYKDKALKAILAVQVLYERFKAVTGMTNESLINLTYAGEYVDEFNFTRERTCNDVKFVEYISFKDWLNMFFC